MSELDQLRSLGDQVVPPSFELLRETARRRTRRRDAVAGAVPPPWPSSSVARSALWPAPRTGARPSPWPAERGQHDPPAHLRPRVDDPLRRADGRRARRGRGAGCDRRRRGRPDRRWRDLVHRRASLEQVGTLGEPGSAYADADHPFGSSWGFVVSDNTGARAAWLEFPQPGEPELVVYDTENAEETAREPLGVDPGSYALLAR